MPGSMKNREMLPIGTRVKPAYDKLSMRIGTVVGHSEDGEHMSVVWDGNEFSYPFLVSEVRPARTGEDNA